MHLPPLYRQLQAQLSQWFEPKDKRHLQGVCEAVAAILQSQSACMSRWIPYLSHRDCSARAHLERLSYLVYNESISPQRFYQPLLRHVLQAFEHQRVTLTLDTSVLWDQFCLVEVCLVWGGRSLTLSQQVLRHASATVGFEQYQPVLAAAREVLPAGCTVTLLADRGFEHGALLRWLKQHDWHWFIRVKTDLQVTLPSQRTLSVSDLLPPKGEVYLFHQVTVLGDIEAHLATADDTAAREAWAVLSDQPTSLHTFERYGQRFGGIEPHFKDYKSAAFDLLDSGLRDDKALSCLLMLLDCASLIALLLGVMLVLFGQRSKLDWHSQRGLSFLQLGLRELARLLYQHLALPQLIPLPTYSPPPACASKKKQRQLDCRIEFDRITRFSG
ncbi:MAG: transposase [Leptolyngbya sp. SIO4C1]|nr:transposase [Leptolyngbya sp. SIO4C1]